MNTPNEGEGVEFGSDPVYKGAGQEEVAEPPSTRERPSGAS
jgi:hypothetical protein